MKAKMQIIMKRAHEIRKESASEHGVKISEIHFGECLKRAWAMTRKCGIDLMIMVEHLLTERNPAPIVMSADDRIWDMEEVPVSWIKNIEYKFQTSMKYGIK